jgi:hypothetical protein
MFSPGFHLSSAEHGGGYWLRVVIMNPETQREHLDQLLVAIVRAIG